MKLWIILAGVAIVAGNLTEAQKAQANGTPDLVCLEPTVIATKANPSLSDLPTVRAAPTAGSKEIGITSAVVYAIPGVKEIDGYRKVLHLNGRRGWVQAALLEPWHNPNVPGSSCTGEIRPNGRPHAIYSHP